MAELMASADLAIGAGGSVSWERCCLGLPALVFATAANQQRLVEDAAWRGLMYAPQLRDGRATAIELHLKALLDNPCLLQLISRKGLEYVDGLGAQRVLHEIGCDSIVIRKATHADSENLFTWRNDPSIRAVSRNAKPIDRSTHETWIKAVLSDSDQVLLIGKYQDKAVGVVRFDVKAKEAEVSIYLVPGQQGTGFGTELLLAAENWLAEHRSDVLSIKAEVLDGNQRSHRLFQKCDYRMRSAMYTKQVRQL
jgi:RimJ/RimL family protein N-acetyltransferase